MHKTNTARRLWALWLCLALCLGANLARGQALNGAYTINPTGSGTTNYTTFNLAVNDLKTKGVAGPVTFTVAAGTYSEQVTIPAITGASTTNTITFDGQDTTKCILAYNATLSTAPWTLQYNACQWVTFKRMTIRTLGSSYGWAVHFLTANNDRILKCIIDVSGSGATSTSSNFMGVILNGSATSYSTSGASTGNMIDSSIIHNGYYGIYNSNSSGTNVNYYRFNTLYYAYSGGIYMNSSQTGKVLNNFVCGRLSATTGDGITMFNGNSSSPQYHEIKNNVVINWYYRGIYNATSTGSSGTLRGQCYNNFFTGFRSTSARGISTDGNYWQYYHNTVVLDNAATSTSAYCFGQDVINNSPNDVRNNIFVISNAGATGAIPMVILYSTSMSNVDYNVVYNASDTTKLASIDNNSVYNVSLAKFFGFAGWNKNSTMVKPPFKSATDLHLKPNPPVMRGDPTLGVATDIDGDARCAVSPTPGGDEAVYTSVAITPDFTRPDTTTYGTPIKFVNMSTSSLPTSVEWWYHDTLRATSNTFFGKSFITGYDSMKLIVKSCFGSKSIVKKFYVAVPKSVPTSDFISDINATYTGGTVNFTDLSTGGPAKWKWTISPAKYNDPVQGVINTYKFAPGSDTFSQNPSIIFQVQGKYTVCLTASNIKGSGASKCKTNYVEVLKMYTMCGSTKFANDRSGELFDDGGPTGNYTYNKTGANICKFVISPCNATRAVMRFRNFDLRTGDYLRVFDGVDASGTPLYNHLYYIYGFNGVNTDPTFPDSLVSTTGSFYLEFESDNNTATVGPGFEAYWTSVAPGSKPPTAKIDVPDTVCIGTVTKFTAITTGDVTSYSWDLDADSLEDANKSSANFAYFSGGTVHVRLAVTGCGGTTIVYKDIYVLNPTTAPKPDFSANLTTVGVGDLVNITSKATGCVDAYTWDITPTTFHYVTGSDLTANVGVSFDAPGLYTITLYTANGAGKQSITKTNYIKVVNFCTPVISATKSDIGITRMTLGDINNGTIITPKGYTNYSSSFSTSFDRGGSYKITLERPSPVNTVNRAAWIDYNQDGDFDDAGEMIALDTNSSAASWSASFTVPKTASLGSTRLRVGTVFTSQTIKPCGTFDFGEFEDYRVIIRNDITPPVITLIGKDTVYVELGHTYKDAGAKAFDNVDGDITSKLSFFNGFDSSKVDTLILEYSVVDAAGNKSIKNRIVIITPDATPPVVTLNGKDTIYMEVKTAYKEPGFTYKDNIDGTNVKVTKISNLDTAHVGTYTIQYVVSDKTGNTTIKKRTIIVQDTKKPVAIFGRGDTVKVEVFHAYSESDLKITDNYDSTFDIIRSGTFNFPNNIPTQLGTYTLNYLISDHSGNSVSLTRTIIVVDTTAPIIRLKGNVQIKVKRYSTYTDAGYTLSDNYYPESAITVSKSGTFVNTQNIGTFFVTYCAKDPSGNSSCVTRIVQVLSIDSIAPVIKLKGPATVHVLRWRTYKDSGYVVTDDQDPVTAIKVDTFTNLVTTQVPGSFYISYRATDKSGNQSGIVTRVIIIDENLGIDEYGQEPGISVYPNPSHGEFTLDITLPEAVSANVMIYDMMGRVVRNIDRAALGKLHYDVDMQDQPAGMYFIRLETKDKVYTHKIIMTR